MKKRMRVIFGDVLTSIALLISIVRLATHVEQTEVIRSGMLAICMAVMMVLLELRGKDKADG